MNHHSYLYNPIIHDITTRQMMMRMISHCPCMRLFISNYRHQGHNHLINYTVTVKMLRERVVNLTNLLYAC